MRVTTVIESQGGGFRYYGRHCLGGSVGAYSGDCMPPSEADLKKWTECNGI